MIHIVPGDPVEQMLGEGAAPGEITQLRHALNLDQPLLVQYGQLFEGSSFTPTLGNPSSSRRRPPNHLRALSRHAPACVLRAAGLRRHCHSRGSPRRDRRGHAADRAVSLFTLFGLAFPNFALGPVLILFLLYLLGFAASLGRGGPGSYILPAGNSRRRSRRDPDAHGSWLHARRTLERLRSNGSRQRPPHERGVVSPRISKRADSHHHHSRLAIRHAARRHHS